MKELNRIITLVALAIVVTNCSSVKLANAWSSDALNETKNKTVLVVARSSDMGIRESYENALVSKLKEQNVDAVAAYKLFPGLKEDKNRSQKEIDNIVSMFKKEGISGVMLTALKDTKIETSEFTKAADYGSVSNRGKYGVSFTDYYNVHSIEYISRNLKTDYDDTNVEVPLESTTYILEAVIYDLSLPKDSQLVGIYEVEATDPASTNQVLTNFSDIVSKQFKN